MSYYDEYKVDVPEGECHSANGSAKIEKFTVSEEQAQSHNMRATFQGNGGHIRPGEYTKLLIDGHIIMSDTPSEIRDHIVAIGKAHGRCLVNGLGLGMVINAMLMKEEVESVDVIELNEDVITLVAPHYLERWPRKLDIIQANAFDYMPPKHATYGAVWHDIWTDMCTDNLPEMTKLHRKYGRRCHWQGSWRREYLKCIQAQEKRQERQWVY